MLSYQSLPQSYLRIWAKNGHIGVASPSSGHIDVPTAQPNSETVELYNRLVTLPFDAREAIDQIGWRLHGLYNKAPQNPEVAVAYLASLQMAGKAIEAHSVAGHVWNFRHVMDGAVADTYSKLLRDLGEYERCIELSQRWLKAGRHDDMALTYSVAHLAIGSFDFLERLRDLKIEVADVAFNNANGEDIILSAAKSFYFRLKDGGLLNNFSDYMSVVSGILHGRQTAVDILVRKYDGPAEMVLVAYVEGDRAFRRLLEERIDQAVMGSPIDLANRESDLVTILFLAPNS
jgi:hypothetical protein